MISFKLINPEFWMIWLLILNQSTVKLVILFKLLLQLRLDQLFYGMFLLTMENLMTMLLIEKPTLVTELRMVDGQIHLHGLITDLVMNNS